MIFAENIVGISRRIAFICGKPIINTVIAFSSERTHLLLNSTSLPVRRSPRRVSLMHRATSFTTKSIAVWVIRRVSSRMPMVNLSIA